MRISTPVTSSARKAKVVSQCVTRTKAACRISSLGESVAAALPLVPENCTGAEIGGASPVAWPATAVRLSVWNLSGFPIDSSALSSTIHPAASQCNYRVWVVPQIEVAWPRGAGIRQPTGGPRYLLSGDLSLSSRPLRKELAWMPEYGPRAFFLF